MSISLSRRALLQQALVAAVSARIASAMGSPVGRGGFSDWLNGEEFSDFVRAGMASQHVPGLSLVALEEGRIVHQAGFGLADLEARRPMTPDTLMNIASVTKTITCTAVMQLHEQGRLDLDGPIDPYLPFKVRNPGFAGQPLTARQLLTHTSSVADGPAYEASYHCGDPQVPLAEWLSKYFEPGGAHFDAAGNFHPWGPGGTWAYSNVGYGLLGLLVERIGGLPFPEYCMRNIFAPLGMQRSRFLLAGMDRAAHATTYTYAADGNVEAVELREPQWSAPATNGQGIEVPLCLYSFATPPDGLARCTAAELARFLSAYAQGGALDGARILKAGTVARILSDQRVRREEPGREIQGLAWYEEDGVWGHSGGDPGVATHMAFRPADGRGIVLFLNAHARLRSEIVERVFAWKGRQ